MKSTKSSLITRFYKNVLKKNVDAEICRKFRNVSNSNQHRTLPLNLHKCGNISFKR